jgi:hypothetical protein
MEYFENMIVYQNKFELMKLKLNIWITTYNI